MSKVYGSEEPRIYTKPLRELTPDTSLGFDVIDFSENILKVELLPWQKFVLVHALEIVGSFEDEWHFRFRTVLVLVARQQGKTFLSCILALYFLYVLRVALVLGTAQDVSNAEDVWMMCVEFAQSNEWLAEEIKHVWFTNGSKRLQLEGGRDYRVRASNRKAGRGKSANLVLLDEVREHQTWDAYSALSKTVIAREDALLWCMSNAGDSTSVVLKHLRGIGHAALGNPDGLDIEVTDSDDDTLGIFEWSAPPDADPSDVDAWAQANPSLGYTVTMRAMKSAYATDPEDVFKTECLCQWVTAKVTPPFPADAWDAGRDESSEIAPDSPLMFGVDVSADRNHAAIAVCGARGDGHLHIELVAYRVGIGWLQQWFAEHAGKNGITVAMQGRGAPVSAFVEILSAVDGVEVIKCEGVDVAGWCGRMWDSVASCADSKLDAVPVHHRTQPALDLAAQIAATRPMGDGSWAWDRRKSLEDVSPLVAATMALGAFTRQSEPEKVSVYESDGLLVL